MARHATNPGKLELTNANLCLNAKRCSGRNTRTPVHQETTRKLSETSRTEEVCLKNACMIDVHMTSPHDNHDHDHDHDHLHDTTTKKGLALWWLITLDESSPQRVPARTPTIHWGRYDGRPWVARSTPNKAKSRTTTED